MSLSRRTLIETVSSRIGLGIYTVLGLCLLAVPVRAYFIIAQATAWAQKMQADARFDDLSVSVDAEAHDVVLYYTSPSAARNDSLKCGKAPRDSGTDCYAAHVGMYADAHRPVVAPLVRALRKASTPAVRNALQAACLEKADDTQLSFGELPTNEACVASFVAYSYRVAFQD